MLVEYSSKVNISFPMKWALWTLLETQIWFYSEETFFIYSISENVVHTYYVPDTMLAVRYSRWNNSFWHQGACPKEFQEVTNIEK